MPLLPPPVAPPIGGGAARLPPLNIPPGGAGRLPGEISVVPFRPAPPGGSPASPLRSPPIESPFGFPPPSYSFKTPSQRLDDSSGPLGSFAGAAVSFAANYSGLADNLPGIFGPFKYEPPNPGIDVFGRYQIVFGFVQRRGADGNPITTVFSPPIATGLYTDRTEGGIWIIGDSLTNVGVGSILGGDTFGRFPDLISLSAGLLLESDPPLQNAGTPAPTAPPPERAPDYPPDIPDSPPPPLPNPIPNGDPEILPFPRRPRPDTPPERRPIPNPPNEPDPEPIPAPPPTTEPDPPEFPPSDPQPPAPQPPAPPPEPAPEPPPKPTPSPSPSPSPAPAPSPQPNPPVEPAPRPPAPAPIVLPPINPVPIPAPTPSPIPAPTPSPAPRPAPNPVPNTPNAPNPLFPPVPNNPTTPSPVAPPVPATPTNPQPNPNDPTPPPVTPGTPTTNPAQPQPPINPNPGTNSPIGTPQTLDQLGLGGPARDGSNITDFFPNGFGVSIPGGGVPGLTPPNTGVIPIPPAAPAPAPAPIMPPPATTQLPFSPVDVVSNLPTGVKQIPSPLNPGGVVVPQTAPIVPSPPAGPIDPCKSPNADPCISSISDTVSKLDGKSNVAAAAAAAAAALATPTAMSVKKFLNCQNNAPVFGREEVIVPNNMRGFVGELFGHIADIEGKFCAQQTAIATVPEWWQLRPEAGRTQGIYVYKELRQDGTIGNDPYSITVPHCILTSAPAAAILPEYQKGNYQGVLFLKDNSKLIVNCSTPEECERVISKLSEVIKSDYLTGSTQTIGKHKGRPFKEIRVKAQWLHFFPTGAKSMKPAYIKSFF